MFEHLRRHLPRFLGGKNSGRTVKVRRHYGETSALQDVLDHSKVLGMFMLILVWFVCVLALTMPSFSLFELELMEGQMAPQSVFARNSFSYINIPETENRPSVVYILFNNSMFAC